MDKFVHAGLCFDEFGQEVRPRTASLLYVVFVQGFCIPDFFGAAATHLMPMGIEG
jgi:hypothetical protein